MRARLLFVSQWAMACLACSSSVEGRGADDTGGGDSDEDWQSGASVVVPSEEGPNCRSDACAHDQDTDLITFDGAIFLVYRTAQAATPSANSSLRIESSTDGGTSFSLVAILPAPTGRDLRAPHFFEVGGNLFLEAVSRLQLSAQRDAGVDSVTIASHSADGSIWTPFVDIGPPGWSFWRPHRHEDSTFVAGFEDGDTSVALFSSGDGVAWSQGATIFDLAVDTPRETELVFLPSGLLLALVRLDGTDLELDGDEGRLRTAACWASAPYDLFTCSDELSGARLDGPAAFFAGSRLLVVARQHLQGTGKKRSAVYEITGELEGGPLGIETLGVLPSAGDTGTPGAVILDDDRVLVSWYSGDLTTDQTWPDASQAPTDVWRAFLDPTRLP